MCGVGMVVSDEIIVQLIGWSHVYGGKRIEKGESHWGLLEKRKLLHGGKKQ
jgi:hypothetical protein